MKIDRPRITPPSLAGLVAADAAAALDPAGIDGVRVEGAGLGRLTRHEVTFRESELVRARVERVELTDCRLLDLRLDGIDGPELLTPHSTWRDSEVIGSRLGVLGLYDATVGSLRLKHCKIGFLGLQGADVHDLVLEGCTIEELDLTDASLTRVALRDTTVGLLQLTRSRLHHVDLRESTLGEVTPAAGLAGAAVTLSQLLDLAPLLAAELGVLVD